MKTIIVKCYCGKIHKAYLDDNKIIHSDCEMCNEESVKDYKETSIEEYYKEE